MQQIMVIKERPGCLVQLLWFALVGWWAGQLWIIAAWLLMLTVVGIPMGVAMLNMLPQVIALRGRETALAVRRVGRETLIRPARVPQYNILVRALYFLLIGWWLSAIWMELAYAVSLTIVGLPLGFWMFDRVPMLVSLRR